MIDPNAEPTPAELAAWRAEDVANAKTWAAGRLEKARRIGDVEVRQHLGNLVVELAEKERELDAARARIAALEAENRRLRGWLSGAHYPAAAAREPSPEVAAQIEAWHERLNAAPKEK